MSENLRKDRYFKVGDINTRFWKAGNKGPSVVLIHGLGGCVENWQQNIDAFAEEYRVYALDLPGFGRSDKPAVPYSIPYLAQFVQDFLTTQGVRRATMVGNSMGGAIALELAFSSADMVDKLVLVDAAGFGTEVNIAFRLITVPFIGECLSRPSRKGSENMLRTLFFDPSMITEEMIDFGLELALLPGRGKAFLSTARSFLGFRGVKQAIVKSVIDNAHRLSCPTLIVWGKQDRIFPVEHAHVGAKVIPNATLQLFDACGHCPHLEYPEAFNSTVLQFLAGQGSGTVRG